MAFHYLTAQVQNLSKTYQALQGDVGQPQSATLAIDKLCERLANGATAEDRKAALLGIKGLSRDYKAVSHLITTYCRVLILLTGCRKCCNTYSVDHSGKRRRFRSRTGQSSARDIKRVM